MHSFNNLLNAIKQAATEAVEASKPVAIMYGSILSTSPWKINVEQKMILTSAQLVLTETAKNLKPKDEVLLLQMQGGQKFIVVDKVVKK